VIGYTVKSFSDVKVTGLKLTQKFSDVKGWCDLRWVYPQIILMT